MEERDRFKPTYHNFACSSFLNYSQFSWYTKKEKTQEDECISVYGASTQSQGLCPLQLISSPNPNLTATTS